MSGVSKRNASDIKEDIKQAKDIPPEDTDNRRDSGRYRGFEKRNR